MIPYIPEQQRSDIGCLGHPDAEIGVNSLDEDRTSGELSAGRLLYGLGQELTCGVHISSSYYIVLTIGGFKSK